MRRLIPRTLRTASDLIQTNWYLAKNVGQVDYEEAYELAKAKFADCGFGILDEQDLKEKFVMKNITDETYPEFRMFSGCIPSLAYDVVEAEPYAATLLPCRVVVRQTEDGEVIVFMPNDEYMSDVVGNDAVTEKMAEAMQLALGIFDGWEDE